VLTKTVRIASRLIIAGAAVAALTLAVGIALHSVQPYERMGTWTMVRPSLIAAAFIVMAFVMISYLIRRFSAGKQS